MNHPLWIIITAGGHGARFGKHVPKQYVEIGGKSVIAHSMDVFSCLPNVQAAVVPIPRSDRHFDELVLSLPFPIIKVSGGAQRYLSVANALNKIREHASAEDWVLVHDGVRPCLHTHDLQKLYVSLKEDSVGGILATQVTDTLKHARADGRITQTVSRESLWHALTPQMFRFSLLDEAIAHVIEHDIAITDDASALEHLGYTPKIVQAEHPNPKLTTSQDLPFIENILKGKALCSV